MVSLRRAMAMTSRMAKRNLSIGFGILLFAALVWVALRSGIDLSKIDLRWAVGCIAVYLVMLCLRALNFKLISGRWEERGTFSRWCRLAALHQLIFIVAPSGSGDLTYPALAKRFVGADLSNATGTIVLSRVRDLFTVLGLGALGFLGAGIQPVLAVLIALIAFASLIFTEVAIRFLARGVGSVLAKRPAAQEKLNKLLDAAAVQDDHKALRNLITLAIWLCAGAGVWFGFAAAGQMLSIYECWIIVLFLNVVGALAISIAGLGFAEAGAAGALMLLGASGVEAAAVAVVARPTMLVALIIAALLLERALLIWPSSGSPET